ncbi:hypothetical protein DFH09DRAFT_187017 [Mycena vulgaris]|nr:hypothetical protein DFH09DRAFT_187017 [Mycena vulgaris]
MSQEPEDVKPKLNLNITYEGNQITVKVKPNTKFAKIFQAAEQRFGKESGTFKFVYEGNRISKDDTPADLDIEDGDQIDCLCVVVHSSFVILAHSIFMSSFEKKTQPRAIGVDSCSFYFLPSSQCVFLPAPGLIR